MCFNADGTMICWLKYNEANVKQYSLQMFNGFNTSFYTYKYPKAGDENATVSAWSYDIKSHATRQMNVPLDADGYIPRIYSTNDANKILILTLNRHQDNLKVYATNPRSTVSEVIIEQKDKRYIKENAYINMFVTPKYILMPNDAGSNIIANVYTHVGNLKRSITLPGKDITEV